MKQERQKKSLNKNKIYFGALIFALLFIIGWSAYGSLNSGKNEEINYISVIVEDSNSDRWTSFREGMQQAAEDHNVELTFVSAGNIKSVEEERSIVMRELDNGAQGILMQPYSSEGMEDLMAEVSARGSVLLLESNIESDKNYAVVGPDNTEIGKTVANAVVADASGDLKEKVIGVLCGNTMQRSMIERLEGFTDVVTENGGKVAWIMDESLKNSIGGIDGDNSADIVVALDNDELEKAVDYVDKGIIGTRRCLLYGEGCSQKNVYYLDKGVIRYLVVPNEFNMGYQSVETMADMLQFRINDMEDIETDFVSIWKEDLYKEENQKILFPIVQ